MEESMKLVSLYKKLESYSAKEWAELLKKCRLRDLREIGARQADQDWADTLSMRTQSQW